MEEVEAAVRDKVMVDVKTYDDDEYRNLCISLTLQVN